MDNIKSSFKIQSFLDQNEGKIIQPTWDVGFWEHVYTLEVKRFMNIIEKKCYRVKKLKEVDLFSIPQKEASTRIWQINILTEEITIFYGMKLFMDDMKTCYLDSSIKILHAYKQKLMNLELENYQLKIANANEMASSQLFLEIAIDAIGKLINNKKSSYGN